MLAALGPKMPAALGPKLSAGTGLTALPAEIGRVCGDHASSFGGSGRERGDESATTTHPASAAAGASAATTQNPHVRVHVQCAKGHGELHVDGAAVLDDHVHYRASAVQVNLGVRPVCNRAHDQRCQPKKVLLTLVEAA
jgi:hypothetical protein